MHLMYNSYNATNSKKTLFANKWSQNFLGTWSTYKQNLGKIAKKFFFQLGFSSEIKVPRLGSARLGSESS